MTDEMTAETNEFEFQTTTATHVPEVGCSVEDFVKVWNSLPPLVRASTAYMIISWIGSQGSNKNVESLERMGLNRRANVNRKFDHANAAIQMLFKRLCKEADDEAAAKGLDALDGGSASVEFSVHTKIWRAEKAPSKKKRKSKRK